MQRHQLKKESARCERRNVCQSHDESYKCILFFCVSYVFYFRGPFTVLSSSTFPALQTQSAVIVAHFRSSIALTRTTVWKTPESPLTTSALQAISIRDAIALAGYRVTETIPRTTLVAVTSWKSKINVILSN